MQKYESSEFDSCMSTPVLSLEGFFELDVELPDKVKAQIRAQQQLRAALQEEQDYWERLSSGLFANDASGLDAHKVHDEWREYAVHWAKYGAPAAAGDTRAGKAEPVADLSVLPDFKAHMGLREERSQRRIDAKARRQRATDLKLATVSAAGDRDAQRAAMQRAANERRAAEDAAMFAEVPAPPLGFDVHAALSALELLEEPLRKISDDICGPNDVPEVPEGELRQLCIRGYNHMIETFNTSVAMKRLYGFGRGDFSAAPLVAGGDVPSYFANVQDGSIFRRKLLSMAGLRNLVIYGATIYNQLRDLEFSGDLDAHGRDRGLALMRRVTGNVVDLDTTVLRCTDQATLNAINALNKHKKQPLHKNSAAFGSSSQAQEIAVNCAAPLLEDFAKAMKLTTKEKRCHRRIDPSQVSTPVPVAQHNTDRGKHPVWQYINAGQNSFHCNVPTMADVNGALLKAPLHCLRCWLVIHSLYEGDELKSRVADFFENCVVDACFNGKWKAIEEFVGKMAHEGTIVDVLQKTQPRNQAVFTMEFFDADNDEQDAEVAEMVKLTAGRVAKEAKTGVMRPITEADVRAWVQDPSISI